MMIKRQSVAVVCRFAVLVTILERAIVVQADEIQQHYDANRLQTPKDSLPSQQFHFSNNKTGLQSSPSLFDDATLTCAAISPLQMLQHPALSMAGATCDRHHGDDGLPQQQQQQPFMKQPVSAWSTAGRNLLEFIVGNELEDVSEYYHYDNDGDEVGATVWTTLRDYGFVMPYPQRWTFENDYEELLHWELNEDENGELQLTWLHDLPSIVQLNWLRAHRKRLGDLKVIVTTKAEQLASSKEREMILEYYDALTFALEQAVLWSSGEDDCGYDDEADSSHCYDTLHARQDPLDYNVVICNSPGPSGDYVEIDELDSPAQSIIFEHNAMTGDTCLRLGGWLQTCHSFRPHYHEAFVHYPARFVDQVKRVIYFGGGDNMILHEILKYPTLELVIGMELDQQVVRSSFKNLGTQPHFDNEKVQWWFGDATKSLQMLPSEYFGTFDLVLIDLETFVFDSLMVTKNLSVMDVATIFAKPDGVVARNEDFVVRNNANFAKYMVELEYHDVPILCQQSITMGSNKIDFLKQEPKDLEVETVYLKTRGTNKFDGWYNYRVTEDRTSHRKADLEFNDPPKLGLLSILEVENTSASAESAEDLRIVVGKALEHAGLTIQSVAPPSTYAKSDNSTTIFVLQEGYVVVRAWARLRYIAFDILLWSRHLTQEMLKSELIVAVGSPEECPSSSSYRMVTGGMFGIDVAKEMTKAGPTSTRLCESLVTGADHHEVAAVEAITINEIIPEIIALIQSREPVIAVICAEPSYPCDTQQVLSKTEYAANVITIWACPGLLTTDDFDDSSLTESMVACEQETRKHFLESVALLGKINGIVMDPNSQQAMARILHKIFKRSKTRKELLADQYVVLAPSTETTQWRKALLERFRTDFAQFSPAHRADIVFDDFTRSFELEIFSAGDHAFHSHLADTIARIEHRTGIAAKVRNVQDGLINYIAEFEPSHVAAISDYNLDRASEQWSTQTPVGHQTILQFESQPQKPPLEIGEHVLVPAAAAQHISSTEAWYPGQVLEVMDDGTYEIVHLHKRKRGKWATINLDRDSIRKHRETDTSSTLQVRDRVLIQQGAVWYQGSIVNTRADDEGGYEVHVYDTTGRVETRRRADMIPYLEGAPDFDKSKSERVLLSTSQLSNAFQNAVWSMGEMDGIHNATLHDYSVGDGCLLITCWSYGHAILSWDGRTHIDINIFTHQEDWPARSALAESLLEQIPSLVVVSRDDQPRGFGKVVNFQSQLDSIDKDTHWSRFV